MQQIPSPTIPLEQAQAYWQQLDLSYICHAMCSQHYSLPRWQPELAQACEQLYKRFLWLLVKYPGVVLAPTKAIDEFWHNCYVSP
ncbi:MAG: hypothetical protein GY821_13430 [Gammaproteobacteria bacterium]|nr:hypothetical protein [Gammaproteobacteria bacterium]